MPRRPHPPTTMLGVALRVRRGERRQEDVVDECGLPRGTLARIERGAHAPSADTARALARWLGWTTDQVLDAAGQPAPPTDALEAS